MHRVRGADLKLVDVLARAASKKAGAKSNILPFPVPKRVVYAKSDRMAAKTILKRLLVVLPRNEISSIQEVTTEIEED